VEDTLRGREETNDRAIKRRYKAIKLFEVKEARLKFLRNSEREDELYYVSENVFYPSPQVTNDQASSNI